MKRTDGKEHESDGKEEEQSNQAKVAAEGSNAAKQCQTRTSDVRESETYKRRKVMTIHVMR